MESMNKFKILTICIIAMFIFVVAAIYSNAKDASMEKINEKPKKDSAIATNDISQVKDVSTQVKILNNRIDELNERIDKTVNEQSNELNCKVMGIMTKDGLVEVSSDEVIQQAHENGNDIIVSCSL